MCLILRLGKKLKKKKIISLQIFYLMSQKFTKGVYSGKCPVASKKSLLNISADSRKVWVCNSVSCQKQPSGYVLRKRCSENMQQIYRRTPMQKCDFHKVAKQRYWNHTSTWVFSCKFWCLFSEHLFPKNTSGWLLLLYPGLRNGKVCRQQ